VAELQQLRDQRRQSVSPDNSSPHHPPTGRKFTPNSCRTFSPDASGVQSTGTAMAEAFFYVCFASAILVCLMIIANAFD
jgi:hypothetical protein